MTLKIDPPFRHIVQPDGDQYAVIDLVDMSTRCHRDTWSEASDRCLELDRLKRSWYVHRFEEGQFVFDSVYTKPHHANRVAVKLSATYSMVMVSDSAKMGSKPTFYYLGDRYIQSNEI